MVAPAEALQVMRQAKEFVPATIRMLMPYRGVRVHHLAEAIDVTPPAISARLKGHTVIKQEELVAFSRVLEVPVEVLYLHPDLALRWALDHPSTSGSLGRAIPG